jgi:hypothetical protein
MPKRTTVLYTSNDAPKTAEAQLWVYYCRYSGKPAFTTGELFFCVLALSVRVSPRFLSKLSTPL